MMGEGDAAATAARELVERYGHEGARLRAAERVAKLEMSGDWPSHALAARVLNEVERLAAEKTTPQVRHP
jgi:hypothetical protein